MSNPSPESRRLSVRALAGLPMFAAGMSVGGEILRALAAGGYALADGDVVVIAQKIVSKAEGRARDLTTVAAGARALALAAHTARDASVIELMLAESSELLRAEPAAVIARHRSGHVLANAGIDASNVVDDGGTTVLLWPHDPDASARAIRADLARATGLRLGIVIADSIGRAWRIGTVGTAIGCAGVIAVDDRRGRPDLFGRTLQATVVAVADMLAASAVLMMGEGDEGTPVVVVSGAARWVTVDDGPGAQALVRPVAEDMFR